jgi:purine-binding chemotaxis protein CheW
MSAPVSAQDARWDALARAAARRRDGDTEGADLLQLLAFQVAGTPYALPVERVREIVRVRPVTPMPRVPAEVLGLISLRGEIVQVLDLRRRLGLAEAEPTRASRVMIVHGGDGRVAGLLVDAVTEVMSVSEEELQPPSGDAAAVESLFVRGERFVSILDLDRVWVLDER